MAHALRDALQVKAVETTHSECLELIAKTFGFENWNILSAKIEAARSQAPDAPALAPAAVHDQAPQKTGYYCSFCGKSQHVVGLLIAGPTVFICEECVGACTEIIEDQEIWNLLKADEERGNQAYPAVLKYVRAMSTEDVASCVERSKNGVERQRLHLQRVQQVLAMRSGEGPAAGAVLASPVFAYLRNKTNEDLLVVEQHARRDLKRYDDTLRIAASVLGARGP
jgi:hypothetical protein